MTYKTHILDSCIRTLWQNGCRFSLAKKKSRRTLTAADVVTFITENIFTYYFPLLLFTVNIAFYLWNFLGKRGGFGKKKKTESKTTHTSDNFNRKILNVMKMAKNTKNSKIKVE